jgi:putative addiction module killer protein
MKEVYRSSIYIKWLKNLQDTQAKAKILVRVDRLAAGNSGDSRFLGDISELRINYGPGYRIYFKDTGKEIIILLCGGNKTTQQEDIVKAREIAKLYDKD